MNLLSSLFLVQLIYLYLSLTPTFLSKLLFIKYLYNPGRTKPSSKCFSVNQTHAITPQGLQLPSCHLHGFADQLLESFSCP